MLNDSREIWADNAKFIGVALMLLGHNSLANNYLFDFIYSFHMPLFFILGGYFASTKKLAFSIFIKKNFKQLIIPYVFFYILTLPFGLSVIYLHPYNHPYANWVEFFGKPLIGMFTVETTSFSFHTNGPTWFLVALFIVRIFFYFASQYKKTIRSLIITSLASIIILGIIQHFFINLYGRLDVALLAYPLYVIGFLVRKYDIIRKIAQTNLNNKIFWAIAALIGCVMIGSYNGHVEFSAANYGKNMGLMYIAATLGTLGVCIFSTMIKYNKYILKIGCSTLILLGLHSPIQTCLKYLFHFLFGIPEIIILFCWHYQWLLLF